MWIVKNLLARRTVSDTKASSITGPHKNYPRKSSLKLITETAKEVAKIYEKETGYPYWYAFIFYWIVLFIHVVGGGNPYDSTIKTKENR